VWVTLASFATVCEAMTSSGADESVVFCCVTWMVRPVVLRVVSFVVDVDVAGVAFGAGGDVDADVSESVPGVREEGARRGWRYGSGRCLL